MKTFVVVYRYGDHYESETLFFTARDMPDPNYVAGRIRGDKKRRGYAVEDVHFHAYEEVPTNPLPFKELWK